MKTLRIILGVFTLMIAVVACKKAGTGGQVTVAAIPQHHGKSIYGATVYVKFNTKDSPGTDAANYDMTIVGDATEEHVHIEGLKKGDYYFYAVGYDSAISMPVYGGVPITIKEKSGEIDLEIPVVE